MKGVRAWVVLAILPLFVSFIGQYSRAAFYYFFELRARSSWRCHFLEEEGELNANSASSQRKCENAWKSDSVNDLRELQQMFQARS